MAETCIVCLGDLHHIDSIHTALGASSPRDQQTGFEVVASPSLSEIDSDELIARLLPCGHSLHDSCLKPWVERANSCPICRVKFNSVELSAMIGGPTLSTYAVQDKQQVADLDPSMIVEDEGDSLDENIDPCMVCESYGDESQLLLCDGCDHSCHVFCAGLDGIPAGSWFCYDCQHEPQASTQPSRRVPHSRQRQRPARRGRPDPRASWARLWQSVARRTDLDLDFPFDLENAPAERRQAERREFQDWQRRFQVAARAAGPSAANQFRGIAPVRQEKAEPESQDEIRAWNAFEKARIVDEDERPRSRRKRKSPTASPATEPQPAPERKRKRPRTMRLQDPDLTDSTAGESSRGPRAEGLSAPRPRRDRVNANDGPTFLQSLLDEVEAHSIPASNSKEPYPGFQGDFFPLGSERSCSPDASPVASNHATPRSMTPPPFSPASPSLRPSSPTTLTSNVTPIFPPVPDFTPKPHPVRENSERARSKQRVPTSRQSPGSSPARLPIVLKPCSILARTAPSSNDSTPKATSPIPQQPNKTKLDIKTKTEIQALVVSALQPHYQTQKINKDEYTDINRDVSRRLYEQIGTEDGLTERERWQKVAIEEVQRAVIALRKEAGVEMSIATAVIS